MKVRGSGMNSEPRFEWFKVRLLKVQEVRGSEISGSFQVYTQLPSWVRYPKEKQWTVTTTKVPGERLVPTIRRVDSSNRETFFLSPRNG